MKVMSMDTNSMHDVILGPSQQHWFPFASTNIHDLNAATFWLFGNADVKSGTEFTTTIS
jgi:hypothetical protein